MASLEAADLQRLAQSLLSGAQPTPRTLPSRPLSIWEITTWVLPMASEHLRRVLAQNPALPQGAAGAEGGTRWFAPSDVLAALCLGVFTPLLFSVAFDGRRLGRSV